MTYGKDHHRKNYRRASHFRALPARRGELDGMPDAVVFADHLETAAIETVEAGVMTGDLLLVADRNLKNRKVSTGDFIDAVADHLQGKLYA
jgi:isocitrate dehydrogenase